jgi:hypothetical protein
MSVDSWLALSTIREQKECLSDVRKGTRARVWVSAAWPVIGVETLLEC